MNWYLQALKKYAEFSGRARRKEYWIFALFNAIFLIAAVALDNIAGTTIKSLPYGLFYILYVLAVLIPGIAVMVRRLHDVGKSGWMYFIVLIPIVGAIWLFVLMVTDSNPGVNKYGPNPKESISDVDLENNTQFATPKANNNLTSDTLVLIVVIWLVVNKLFWTIIPKFITSYYLADWYKSINIIMGLIWATIPIALAFAVKNKSKQIVLFILGGLYFLYGFYEIIMELVK